MWTPQTALSALLGQSTAGTWTLIVSNFGDAAATLNSWSLTLPVATPDSGLGDPVADRTSLAFRIFNIDAGNSVSQDQWTAVGPASENNGADSGPVAAIAVDPSDASGNTVYVAGATGGIWKTTNFLTTSASGPSYIPLTNLGPEGSLNISSLAVFGQNNNPDQSVIFALTGNPNTTNAPGDIGTTAANTVPVNSGGIGLLRSLDGGQTWEVLDSTNNLFPSTDGNPNDGLPFLMSSSSRDHIFDGLVGYQVVVDPTPLPGGGIAVYAAFSGPAGDPAAGVWQSLDGGADWTQMQAGNATSVVLEPGSTNANGNLETLFAGIQGQGVFYTTSATARGNTLFSANGGPGNFTRQDDSTFPNSPIPILNTVSPSQGQGRIALAVPALTASPLLNSVYGQWIYAAVANPPTPAGNGNLFGLYVSKDDGNDWTQIQLPGFVQGNFIYDVGTDNSADPSFVPFLPHASTDLALTVDPNNPEVIYLGVDGTLLRIDITKMSDADSLVAQNYSDPSGAVPTTNAPVTLLNVKNPYGILDITNPLLPIESGQAYNNEGPNYYNLLRDPNAPFEPAATTQQLENVTSFANTGFGVLWGEIGNVTDTEGVDVLGGGTSVADSIDMHQILAIRDPLTGQTRLVVGNDNGVFTGVTVASTSSDEFQLQANVGETALVTGSRNGDLQLAQMTDSAAQPSELAASISDALFYGDSRENGFPVSTASILQTGNLNWSWLNASSPPSYEGDGSAVATDLSGTGQSYAFDWPEDINQTTPAFSPNDFFQVTGPQSGGAVSRSGPGVLTIPSDNLLSTPTFGEWAGFGGSRFAVNPIDPTGIVVSSETGVLFRTTASALANTGQVWTVIEQTGANAAGFRAGTLDGGSYFGALAFGAPTPGNGSPDPVGDNFIYAGDQAGNIFVTFNGGTTWSPAMPGLDGSPVEQIEPDPNPGTHDAFAVTQDGVYYIANSQAAGATWVNITNTGGCRPGCSP